MKKYTVIGFVFSALIIGLMVYISGYKHFIKAFIQVNPSIIFSVLFIGLMNFTFLSLAIRQVFAASGRDISLKEIMPIYFSSTFLNCVTPLGQAGGEPAAAYLFYKKFNIPYEESLATVMINDLILGFVFIPFLFISVLIGFVLQTGLETLLIMSFGLIISLFISGTLVLSFTTYRTKLKSAILWLADKLNLILTKIPKVRDKVEKYLSQDYLTQKLNNFFTTIDIFRENLRDLKIPVSIAALSFVLRIAVSVLLLSNFLGGSLTKITLISIMVVTLSSFAFYAPLPGGTGGVEAAFASIIVFFTALPLSSAVVIAVLYRVGFYWVPFFLGLASIGYISEDILSKST